jgi:hypothetical protein
MSSDLYVDEKGNSFIAIPNKADGNCLFESLAYFRDKAKEPSLENYAHNLRQQLCTTYKDIFNKTKRNLDEDLVNSYAYEFNKESQRLSNEMKEDPDYKKEDDDFYDVKTSRRGKTIIKTYIEHYKHVCKNSVWASASDLVLLSFLIKKIILLYTKDSKNPQDPIRLEQTSPEPYQENTKLLPKGYDSWPTIHILYNGHSHFEALVPLTNIDLETENEKKFNEEVKKIKEQANMLPHEELTSIEKKDIEEAIKRSKKDQITINVSDSQREAIKEKQKELLNKPVSPKETGRRTSKRVANREKGKKLPSLFNNSPSNTKKIKTKKVAIKSPSTKKGQTRKTKMETTSIEITANKPSSSDNTKVNTSSTIDTSKQVSKTNVDVKKDNVGIQEKKKAKDNVEKKNPIQIQLNDVQKSAVEERKEQLYVPKRGQNLVIIKSIRPIANELTLQNDARTLRRIVPNLRKTKKQRKNKFEVKYENGEVYHCSLKNKKKHGLGIYKFKNGDVYMGQYKNGEKHGEGVYQYKDGAKYQGPYVDGKRNGKGVYITPGGKKIEVLFVDNVLVKNK